MNKFILISILAISIVSCECEAIQKLQADNEQLVLELKNSQSQLEEIQNQCKSPGLIHSVFFWLKEDISENDRQAFLTGVASLEEVETIQQMYVGPPAATEERGVVDNSYSYALIVHFSDLAGQDAYQIDPIHLKFVDEQQDKWTKVVVYDSTVGN